jgi:hypothetical protein
MDLIHSHNILRAIYFDKESAKELEKKKKGFFSRKKENKDNDDFFISLVIFCLKLRNLGIFISINYN